MSLDKVSHLPEVLDVIVPSLKESFDKHKNDLGSIVRDISIARSKLLCEELKILKDGGLSHQEAVDIVNKQQDIFWQKITGKLDD